MIIENSILCIFAGVALAAGLAIWRFFRRGKDQPPRSLTFGRWALGNVLIVLFILGLILTAGEVYYRFFYDSTDAYMLTKISRRWLHKHYHINGSEVRDSTEYLWKTAPGKRRITFLGDSFTVGHGVRDVENRFANRIRQRQPEWEIQILAKNGWETGDELTLLETELRADYQVDTVVLVYVLNDISDLSIEYYRNAVRRVNRRWQLGPFWNESYFLNTWYYRLRIVMDPDLGNYFHYVKEWYHGPLWEAQTTRLRQLHDAITRRGGRMMVVTFPFLQSAGKDYPFQEIHAQMDDLWSSLDVPHLDLSETLFTYPARRLVVNRFDAHPNELAHDVAARAMEEFIQEHLNNP